MTDKKSNALGNMLAQIASDNKETIMVELNEEVLQQLSPVFKDLGDVVFTCKRNFKMNRVLSPSAEFKAGDVYKVTDIDDCNSELSNGETTGNFYHDDIGDVFVWYPSELQYKMFLNAAKDVSDNRHNKLRQLASLFLAKETFQVGDEVVWKPGLRYFVRPLEGEIAIVLEVLSKPLNSREVDPDSHRAGQINDIVIGILDSEGELESYLADSRRFTKYAPKG